MFVPFFKFTLHLHVNRTYLSEFHKPFIFNSQRENISINSNRSFSSSSTPTTVRNETPTYKMIECMRAFFSEIKRTSKEMQHGNVKLSRFYKCTLLVASIKMILLLSEHFYGLNLQSLNYKHLSPNYAISESYWNISPCIEVKCVYRMSVKHQT